MSRKSFQQYDLSKEIKKALLNLGFESPTEVQEKVVPVALEKRDLVVKSPTGSGKTAAFSIPICELVEWEENKPQALILTPTRELAAQVNEDITNIGRYKRIKATSLYGRQSFERQKIELKQKNHVVVGTPGRVLDHIEKGTFVLDRLHYVVIDEADEMLNRGFIDQVEAIIRKLPLNRVTFTFSATIDEEVEALCHKYMKRPLNIEVNKNGLTTNRISHSYLQVREEEKLDLLQGITTVENADSCMIFCRTKEKVDTVYKKLADHHYPVRKIHGGMVQEDRFAVMNQFKRGKFRYLVATDIAARGIDVDSITHVINYDLPLEKERYVHRIGRTGRMGKNGKAITFLTPGEQNYMDEIEEYVGFTIPKMLPPTEQEVANAKTDFERKIHSNPKLKTAKHETFNNEIMKLYFNGGKKKKLRAIDFVGTIAKIKGVSVADIGIITIQENLTYVDILNGKGSLVLREMKTKTIKGKQLKVHQAKK
ncbi:DEAD/DEAH box helicase [Bacillus spongiae]|uniref:ATP-dependent RNA helicase DbpA n=1 Tax=Bacillus spongiae TaxID=2683610 RepID=A0ABU8HEA6_9BACI